MSEREEQGRRHDELVAEVERWRRQLDEEWAKRNSSLPDERERWREALQRLTAAGQRLARFEDEVTGDSA